MKKRKIQDRNRAGMTLVEVAIAMGILALSVLSVLAMVDMAARTAARSDRVMRQAHLARTIMEDLKTQGYYSGALTLGTHTLNDGYYQVVASTNYVGAKDIHLTLQWVEPGAGGFTRQMRLSTTVSEALHE